MKMTPLEQARELLSKVDKSLKAMDRRGFKDKITESEVAFRFLAIDGMLVMARNDIIMMIEFWEESEPQ